MMLRRQVCVGVGVVGEVACRMQMRLEPCFSNDRSRDGRGLGGKHLSDSRSTRMCGSRITSLSCFACDKDVHVCYHLSRAHLAAVKVGKKCPQLSFECCNYFLMSRNFFSMCRNFFSSRRNFWQGPSVSVGSVKTGQSAPLPPRTRVLN